MSLKSEAHACLGPLSQSVVHWVHLEEVTMRASDQLVDDVAERLGSVGIDIPAPDPESVDDILSRVAHAEMVRGFSSTSLHLSDDSTSDSQQSPISRLHRSIMPWQLPTSLAQQHDRPDWDQADSLHPQQSAPLGFSHFRQEYNAAVDTEADVDREVAAIMARLGVLCDDSSRSWDMSADADPSRDACSATGLSQTSSLHAQFSQPSLATAESHAADSVGDGTTDVRVDRAAAVMEAATDEDAMVMAMPDLLTSASLTDVSSKHCNSVQWPEPDDDIMQRLQAWMLPEDIWNTSAMPQEVQLKESASHARMADSTEDVAGAEMPPAAGLSMSKHADDCESSQAGPTCTAATVQDDSGDSSHRGMHMHAKQGPSQMQPTCCDAAAAQAVMSEAAAAAEQEVAANDEVAAIMARLGMTKGTGPSLITAPAPGAAGDNHGGHPLDGVHERSETALQASSIAADLRTGTIFFNDASVSGTAAESCDHWLPDGAHEEWGNALQASRMSAGWQTGSSTSMMPEETGMIMDRDTAEAASADSKRFSISEDDSKKAVVLSVIDTASTKSSAIALAGAESNAISMASRKPGSTAEAGSESVQGHATAGSISIQAPVLLSLHGHAVSSLPGRRITSMAWPLCDEQSTMAHQPLQAQISDPAADSLPSGGEGGGGGDARDSMRNCMWHQNQKALSDFVIAILDEPRT